MVFLTFFAKFQSSALSDNQFFSIFQWKVLSKNPSQSSTSQKMAPLPLTPSEKRHPWRNPQFRVVLYRFLLLRWYRLRVERNRLHIRIPWAGSRARLLVVVLEVNGLWLATSAAGSLVPHRCLYTNPNV